MEDSNEGVSSFVVYWLLTLNYAFETGDVRPVVAASDESCSGCKRYFDLIEDIYSEGGYIQNGAWSATDFSVDRATSPGGETYIETTISIEASTSRESKDTDEVSSPADEVEISFALRRDGEHWTVTQLGLGEVQ